MGVVAKHNSLASQNTGAPAPAKNAAHASSFTRYFTFANALALSLFVLYAVLFVEGIAPYWFNPRWTTDDGVQQLFPFYSVLEPEIFRGDLIHEVMQGYLAPLHFGIGALITLATKDPIMTGHYLFLLQLVLALGFLFATVRLAAGFAPACLSTLWLLHNRPSIQRMTGGLPRGWAVVLVPAFFYLLMSKRYRGVLALIFFGCLLNPPVTFLIAAAYGLFLSLRCLSSKTRSQFTRPFLELCLCTPIFIATTLFVTHRPDYVGSVATLEEASTMPEFSRRGGRFSFLPFMPWQKELPMYGLRAFTGKNTYPSEFWQQNTGYFVLGSLALLLLIGLWRKRSIIPLEFLSFGAAALIVYFLSRPLAFRLYVPDRHIHIPVALFFIAAFTVGIWRAFHLRKLPSEFTELSSRLKNSGLALVGFCALGFVIYSNCGLNLAGDLNFNYPDTKRGYYSKWLKENTDPLALIAGQPTLVDPVPLFAKRKVYASSETWHPFYTEYNREMKRRIAISLRAHYAKDLNELLELLTPEGVDYFVFERKAFYPHNLSKASYLLPFSAMVKELGSRPPSEYAYRQLPRAVDLDKAPYMPYRDNLVAVVDVKKLQEYLNQ
jgi:hypothetical protein